MGIGFGYFYKLRKFIILTFLLSGLQLTEILQKLVSKGPNGSHSFVLSDTFKTSSFIIDVTVQIKLL